MTATFITASIDDPPPGYPADWEQSVILKEGGTVRIRPIAPGDAPGLQDLVRSMSTESSYFRFFRVKKELTEEELEEFTQLDYRAIGWRSSPCYEGRIIGVGRYNTFPRTIPPSPRSRSPSPTGSRARASARCCSSGSPPMPGRTASPASGPSSSPTTTR